MDTDPLVSMVVGGIVAAFVLGFIAHKLRLSPIVGYLLAGVAIGPHTPGFSADLDLARELADLGVILILFGVGLKFSPHKLSIAGSPCPAPSARWPSSPSPASPRPPCSA